MRSADCAVARCLSVCLSVRLSHAGIVSKRLNISSKLYHDREYGKVVILDLPMAISSNV